MKSEFGCWKIKKKNQGECREIVSCFRRRPGSRNWRAAGTKPVTSMAERIRASRGHRIQSSTATCVLPRGSLPAPSLRSLPRHGTRHHCGAVEIVKRALATAPTRSSSAKSRSVTLGTFPVSADLPSAFRVHRAGRPPAAPDVQAQHAPGTGVGAGAAPGSPDLIPPGRAVSPGASNGAALNCRQSERVENRDVQLRPRLQALRCVVLFPGPQPVAGRRPRTSPRTGNFRSHSLWGGDLNLLILAEATSKCLHVGRCV